MGRIVADMGGLIAEVMVMRSCFSEILVGGRFLLSFHEGIEKDVCAV